MNAVDLLSHIGEQMEKAWEGRAKAKANENGNHYWHFDGQLRALSNLYDIIKHDELVEYEERE